jgi:hypothetical protein
MQEFTIPFIACCYFDGGWDVLFCISDLKMNFIPEEGEILAFISLCCMAIGFESLKMRGVYGEFQVFNSDETKTLSNKISHDFTEDLHSKSFPEVVEGVVPWSFTIGETTEKCEPSIESEFMSEVSFRGSITEIDEENSLKEGLGVITFTPLVSVSVFNEIIDKGEVNGIKEGFNRVIGWDKRGYFKINEIKLSFSSHSMSSFWN